MEWFEEWFDTEYYHILYSHRDDNEAHNFINNLYQYFNIKKSHKILDLACGKGRHSLFMAKKGNQVYGIDLSKKSIDSAIDSSKELDFKTNFLVEDMRNFSLYTNFDFVFNLFTSFGYFENISDNARVVKSVSNHQNPGNIFLIDFLNSKKVRDKGNEEYTKELSGLKFHIKKEILSHHVTKSIKVETRENDIYHFREKVQLFNTKEIEKILIENGYLIEEIFGDYNLSICDSQSDRNIFIAMKK